MDETYWFTVSDSTSTSDPYTYTSDNTTGWAVSLANTMELAAKCVEAFNEAMYEVLLKTLNCRVGWVEVRDSFKKAAHVDSSIIKRPRDGLHAENIGCLNFRKIRR